MKQKFSGQASSADVSEGRGFSFTVCWVCSFRSHRNTSDSCVLLQSRLAHLHIDLYRHV